MVSGKTKTGFEYTVNEAIRTDWRFVKALADADSSDASRQLAGAVRMVTLLLGEKGEAELEKHVAQEDGIVPTESIINEVRDILNGIGEEIKN